MTDPSTVPLPESWADLPAHQRRIRARAAHPAGSFVEFRPERIAQSVAECFEQQVERQPDRVAVRARGATLTYAELNAAANRIARALLDRPELARAAMGRSADAVVGLLFHHGPAFVAASLGAFKAGGIQIALDAGLPPPHLDAMLRQSGCRVLVTDTASLPLARALTAIPVIDVDAVHAGPSANPGLRVPPGAATAIAYTSGSTGEPKGMVWSHEGLLHAVMRHTNATGMCPDDGLLMFRPSPRACLYALLSGATFHPFDLRGDGVAGVGEWMAREGVTVYRSPVSTFRAIASGLAGGREFPRLRLVILLGEPTYRSDVELYRTRFRGAAALASSLGCAEFDDYAYFYVDRDGAAAQGDVPGGYASRDVDILLLGEDGRPVDGTGIGEIAIRSRYNALGYWRRPDLTRAAFVADPGGGRVPVFRTRDLARRDADGCIFHLGRTDFQVKIRGHRVEVGEVEAALRALDGVREAVVVSREDTPGHRRLVAYVTAAGESAPSPGELRRGLGERVPDHMRPSLYVVLAALPRTAAGKVDRRALPPPDGSRPALDAPFVAPHTPLEHRLAAIWADVLGLDRVGVHDAFVELGGDSLQATRVVSRVLAELDGAMAHGALLAAQTVAEMAALIVRHGAGQLDPSDLHRMLADLETRPGPDDLARG